MRHRTVMTVALAALAATVAACTPPPPAVELIPPVLYYPIANTEADIAWCVSHPGGTPEWDPQVPGQLLCRIVP
jgi:hypothetical protein